MWIEDCNLTEILKSGKDIEIIDELGSFAVSKESDGNIDVNELLDRILKACTVLQIAIKNIALNMAEDFRKQAEFKASLDEVVAKTERLDEIAKGMTRKDIIKSALNGEFSFYGRYVKKKNPMWRHDV